MESPTVYVIAATTAELQATLKSTVRLANQPDTRVIIVVSRSEGLTKQAAASAERYRWPFALLATP